MPNPLVGAVANLSAGLKQIGGETTTYRRSNDTIDGVIGVPVRVRHDQLSDEAAVSVTSRDRDWIYWQEELVIGGERLEPRRGDEVVWIDPLGVTHVYQVLPRDGDRCYRHTDPTMQQLRVYTVEVVPSQEV